jgi:hypothetical protein
MKRGDTRRERTVVSHEIERLIERLRSDSGLRARLLGPAPVHDRLASARAAGHDVSAQDLVEIAQRLTDPALKGVYGGQGEFTYTPTPMPRHPADPPLTPDAT